MDIKIGLASDHAGKELKHLIIDYLKLEQIEVVDFGVAVDSKASVDYPDYASILAKEVSSGKVGLGIAVCGTGIGMSIAANKFPGVRAALVWDEFTARMARSHNNANVLCLGARTINHHRAIDIVKVWLEARYEGGRHDVRVDKIRRIEQKVLGHRS